MPIRQLADAAAASTVALAITNSQTTVTVQSAAGFPAILSGGGQVSVIILDTGNPAYLAASPLATNYEYQSVNNIAGNVLTFGTGGFGGTRAAYGGTTPVAFFAGATVAMVLLAEDIVSSAPWKFDEQLPSGLPSLTIPAAGSIPASYLGINFRTIQIVVEARGTRAAINDDLILRFNGDSTIANYSYNQLYANSNLPFGQGVVGAAPLALRVPAATAGANLSGSGVITIPSFARTTFYKTFQATGVSLEAGAAANFWTMVRTGNWANTAAITSVTLAFSGASNFVAGSIVSTYLLP